MFPSKITSFIMLRSFLILCCIDRPPGIEAQKDTSCAGINRSDSIPMCQCKHGCSSNNSAHTNSITNAINAAFARAAAVSSVGEPPTANSSEYLPACGAVNGHRTNQLCDSHQSSTGLCQTDCFITAKRDWTPWWYVTLGRAYTIPEVQIYSDSRYYANMAGIVVKIDAEMCYEFEGYGTDDGTLKRKYLHKTLHIRCDVPIKGSRVLIQKTERADHSTANYQLVLCEVQIWVCKYGSYGDPTQENLCSQCPPCDYECDNFYGCQGDNAYNVAAYKDVEMEQDSNSDSVSGSAAEADPSKMVDGDTTSLGAHNCPATLRNDPQTSHALVDLKGAFAVKRIIITASSGDDDRNNLNHFRVYVSFQKSANEGTEAEEDELCVNFTVGAEPGKSFFDDPRAPTRPFPCRKTLYGRYVILHNRPLAQLIVCELQVFGYEVNTDLQPGDRCSDKCHTNICHNNGPCQNNICRISAGEPCAQGREDPCGGTMSCMEGICKYDTGEKCSKAPSHCRDEAQCYAFNNTYKECRVKLGSGCAYGAECGPNAMCDTNQKCALNSGEPCTESTPCMIGTVCNNNRCGPKDKANQWSFSLTTSRKTLGIALAAIAAVVVVATGIVGMNTHYRRKERRGMIIPGSGNRPRASGSFSFTVSTTHSPSRSLVRSSSYPSLSSSSYDSSVPSCSRSLTNQGTSSSFGHHYYY